MEKGRGSREPSDVGELCYEGSASQTHGRARSSFYSTSSAFCAASCAWTHAAGSVSVTPRATTSRLSLMTSQYQRPSSPLGIMRNSTFAMLCCLRPEMSIRVNQDTIHCAALGAQKSTQAQLSAPRRNIGHLIHRGGAFLAVSWSHHKSQRLDRPSGFLAAAALATSRRLVAVGCERGEGARDQLW